MQIFVINGNPRSGKTTFGRYVGESLRDINIPFLHGSSIDPVKHYLKEKGWKGKKWDGRTKDEFWREAMYNCKLMILSVQKHYFDQYALSLLSGITEDDTLVISKAVLFFDVREPENIQQLVDYIHDHYSEEIEIKTVFVDRVPEEKFNNYADTNQDKYEYDITIDNTKSLEDLQQASSEFVDRYIMDNGEQYSELNNKA